MSKLIIKKQDNKTEAYDIKNLQIEFYSIQSNDFIRKAGSKISFEFMDPDINIPETMIGNEKITIAQ